MTKNVYSVAVKTNNEKLKDLMKRYHLNHKLVALITGVRLWRVNAWCLKPDQERYQDMSDEHLEKVKAVCQFIYPFYFSEE